MPVTNISRRDASLPLTEGEALAVLGLATEATRADGGTPLSEQFRLGVESRESTGTEHVLAHDEAGALVGYAQVRRGAPGDPPSAELFVSPPARRHGVGTALLAALPADVRVWSHLDSRAATGFALASGLRAVRSLHRMGRRLAGGPAWPPASIPERYAVRSFERGRDEAEWLRVNAAAFAAHPEQGSLARADLDQRMAQPWFDPTGFILVVDKADPDHVVAFHWTKVDPPDGPSGEVYAVGVAPERQGEGLGRAVTILGLDHLRARGLDDVELYVDEDNTAALRTYRGLGFESLEVHRQYAAGGADG